MTSRDDIEHWIGRMALGDRDAFANFILQLRRNSLASRFVF